MTQPPPLPCPYCNTPVQRGWKACPACGGVFNLLTPLAQPPPAPGYPPPQTVIVMQPKSVGLAFLLALLFGPLGLLYSTVTGFLVTFVAALALGVVTGGLGACLLWPVCLLWAIGAASSSKQVSSYTGAGAAVPPRFALDRRGQALGLLGLIGVLAFIGPLDSALRGTQAVSTPVPAPRPVAQQLLPLATTPVPPTVTPDAAATRQAAAKNDRATLVAGVTGAGSDPTPTATAVAIDALQPYTSAGVTWRTFRVPVQLPAAQLVDVAQALHSRYPATPFGLVDDSSEFAAFVVYQQHYGQVRDSDGLVKDVTDCLDIAYCVQLSKADQMAYPAPEPWMTQHYLGIVQRMGTGKPGGQWQWTPYITGEIVDLTP